MSNQRLKQRRERAKKVQEYHLQRSWERFLREGRGQTLRAKTTKAAKQQGKRLFPLGCLIKGYHTVVNIDLTNPYPECIYECVILPQGNKQPGGRSAFSSREEILLNYKKQIEQGIERPPLEWIKPEWFEVELYN
jgi:hypothetical protein